MAICYVSLMSETKKQRLSSISKNELLYATIVSCCSHELISSDFESLFVYLNTLFDTTLIPDQYIPLYIDLCFFFSGSYRERKPIKNSSSQTHIAIYQASSEAWESFYENCGGNPSYQEMYNTTSSKLYLKDRASAYAATLAFQTLEGVYKEVQDNEETQNKITFDFQFPIIREKKDKYKKITDSITDIISSEEDSVITDKFENNLISFFNEYNNASKNLTKEFESQDFWEIINFENLPEKSTRMGFRQISRAKTSFGEIHPATKSVILNVLRNEMSLDPDVEKYPIGGFAEITNNGELDNIVRTELVYCGENISNNFDIFDLRLVQKEATFYTRDQSISFDPKRYILISMKNLKDICYKTKDQPYQVKVITIALVSKFIDDFISIFKKTASKVDILCDKEDANIFTSIYNYEIEKGFINIIEETDYDKYSGVVSVNKEIPDFISLIPGNVFKIRNESKTESFVYSEINMRNIVDSLLIHSAKIRNKSFFISLREAIKNKGKSRH